MMKKRGIEICTCGGGRIWLVAARFDAVTVERVACSSTGTTTDVSDFRHFRLTAHRIGRQILTEEKQVVGYETARLKRASRIVELADRWSTDPRSVAIMQAAKELVRLGIGNDCTLQSPLRTPGTTTTWSHRSGTHGSSVHEITYDPTNGVSDAPLHLLYHKMVSEVVESPVLELSGYSTVGESARYLVEQGIDAQLEHNNEDKVKWIYQHPRGDRLFCTYTGATGEWEGIDFAAFAQQNQHREILSALTGLTAEAMLQQALPDAEVFHILRRSAQNLVDLDAPRFTFEGINDQQQVVWQSPNSYMNVYPKACYCPKKRRFDDYGLELTRCAIVMKFAVLLAQHIVAEYDGATPEPDIVAKARRVLRLEKVEG